MTRLAIVGFGKLAQEVYCPAVAVSKSGCSLVGVADPDTMRRQAARAALPDAEVTRDLTSLLSAVEVDGLLISSPPTTHAELALTALERGIPVYLEKPLATSQDDGQRVVEAWRRSGTVAMTGFNYRLNPMIQRLQADIATGRVGPLVAARTSFALADHKPPPWKLRRATGGGALLDLASHHFDLVRFLFSEEVRSVGCRLWNQKSEDDNAVATLELDSGLTVQTFVSFTSAFEDKVEVFGQKGKLVYDRYTSERIAHTGTLPREIRIQMLLDRLGSLIPAPGLREKLRAPWHEPSFPQALDRFCDAIGAGESRSPDLEDGWRCLAVVLAAERAHCEQRVVEVDP